METGSLLLLSKLDKITIGISCSALLLSAISIFLSIRNYRKDRWKLSLEVWIEGPNLRVNLNMVRGVLFVKMANIGSRALTIEGIWLQVFEDELEELRKLVKIEISERTGPIAAFAFTRPKLPIHL